MPIRTRKNIRTVRGRRAGATPDRVLHARIRARAVAGRAFLSGSRILFWVLFVWGAIWGLWAGGSELISKFFINNPEYSVAAVEVSSDAPISREKILSAAGINVGQNIFLVDLRGAQRRLSSLPQVEDAKIMRQLPRNIAIRIRVRRPVAWVAPSKNADGEQLARESFLVDSRGFVFPEIDTDEGHLSLPFIYGCPELPLRPGQSLSSRESLAALELLRITSDTPLGVRLQIQHIDLSKLYCMEVVDRRRSVYRFGTDTGVLREQLDQLGALLQATDSEGRRIQTVNLMMRRNIPVVFAGATPVTGERPQPAATASVRETATPTVPRAQPQPVASARERRSEADAEREELRRPESQIKRNQPQPTVSVQRPLPQQTPSKRGAHDIPLRPFITSP